MPDDVCRVYANLSYVLTSLGRLEDSLAETSRGIVRAREQGVDSSAGAVLLVNAADTLVLLGTLGRGGGPRVGRAAARRAAAVRGDTCASRGPRS
jgi:hypothetical protein